jgi:endonuclease/exonuclease/phosphatase family metal-dependent hydrolase
MTQKTRHIVRIVKIIFIPIILLMTLFFIWSSNRFSSASLSIMTFNIENGGTQIDFSKVVEAIKKSRADVVGIQEPWGHTSRLAQELGWKYASNSQHIISRYPLFETTDSRNSYTLIEVKPGYVVAMANMHLPDENYGPDLIKAGMSAKAVEAMETKIRLPTALPFIQKLSHLAQRGVPVFLTGDFNAPSDLDWQHRKIAVAWPVTKTIEANGFVDAYRYIYPDVIKNAVATWPSGRPATLHSLDGFNPSQRDLPDRIDFIFSANATVISAAIVGEPTYPAASVTVWPWPSDHRAVVASFEVKPVAIANFSLKLHPARSAAINKPTISVAKHTFKSGEPMVISWRNMPANRYDYIMIVPTGSKKTAWGEAVRLYTRGEVSGSLVYGKKTIKGNWLDWYIGSEGHWPMKRGKYDIRLMVDDGYRELGKVQIKVK